ncbi:hypothetical protein AGABI1DRAFT_129419 [Agaricus bisporus var. burnettii JB137-S8]|uniref:DUF6534 domain-containing protein n=1 Tax=Agaricus bisporus var. burnettii (strain JB137-S8 / ATCC MYA-4627 / FGSC 10392) TaxID=597362 RepID=K5XTE6_AGABU|nr:uncharacterized protein AGABI1DRAFT_129419 [Agaricus bisporus var. burnettii JB137-S8]EKM78300.1 hypothetical protein AGABI1DRAFT_129419 [Agaricus bisporus var. burnettii JB137-S8]
MDSLPFNPSSGSTDPLAPLLDLEPSIGSFFLGAIACVGLTGVTTLQAWLYFQRYPQDTVYLKILVLFVWTLEILRSAISIHGGYYYSVKHWGNLLALSKPIWSMKLMIMLTNVVELTVHGFFINKVWQATYGRAKILCILITLFALGDFAMGTVSYVLAVLESSYFNILRGTPSRYATAALCCAIGADWLITGALVKFFRSNKSEFPRTNRVLKKLIFYAVNMGLLTSLADVVVLVLANYPGWKSLNFYQLTVFEIVGNLYANTFLACLNARDMVSEGLSLDPPPLHTFSISFSRSGFGNSNGTTHSSSRAGGGGGGTASQGSHVSSADFEKSEIDDIDMVIRFRCQSHLPNSSFS